VFLIKIHRLLGAATLLAALSASAQEDVVERGKYLTYAGGCISRKMS
jgi:hypothetical protein